MSDPFFIAGPALISFSGGRTSAYMLWRVLQAHGGTLPDDVVVAFANTGKEMEQTLRFVHECATHWNVRVRWVEYRDNEAGFEEVGFNSASRNGEPFAALIAKRGYVPNSQMRFCTTVLKVRTMRKLMLSLGHQRYLNAVGLRADEQWRVAKGMSRNADGKDAWTTCWPLAKAGVTKRDVMAFWQAQPFDLGLANYEGNCDLCFLKRRSSLERLIRDGVDPTWWIEQEQACRATAGTGAQFDPAHTYDDLCYAVRAQPMLIDDDLIADEHDAECGLLCAPDDTTPQAGAEP
jgi:3'-phosphoadenosine 5'-phosphosulfate sulfotransferase (PAPS reductase)/FAD synthetase